MPVCAKWNLGVLRAALANSSRKGPTLDGDSDQTFERHSPGCANAFDA
jgi:hypothetical protein